MTGALLTLAAFTLIVILIVIGDLFREGRQRYRSPAAHAPTLAVTNRQPFLIIFLRGSGSTFLQAQLNRFSTIHTFNEPEDTVLADLERRVSPRRHLHADDSKNGFARFNSEFDERIGDVQFFGAKR
jgi:hypothetical protein